MNELETLIEKFNQASNKNKLKLVDDIIEKGEEGFQFLREFLFSSQQDVPTPVLGKIYQLLKHSNNQDYQNFINDKIPQGIVKPESSLNIDYSELQQLLIDKEYQKADVLTRVKLCEIAGEKAQQRKWLYFTEISKFPISDLHTIDLLWNVYSEGKFGYSVQRKIWLSQGKDFIELWTKLKWKNGNRWTKYPQEFIWDLSAPLGHLPLSNQLRGVREIDALFAHPAWTTENAMVK
ncbi:GUN4 domain protein [Cyanobacterium stanieri PCC 7202]|uniref:GUN4 domain protein n=1 Tax=Cyanobacterium stanieri (strain ATCC 29140 / PCC 7202) TaxID=292563 RepID=K9YMJ4_CYASC|nr:GUN4 domain protein [Cyanobacterium stanieri PCC 7202]